MTVKKQWIKPNFLKLNVMKGTQGMGVKQSHTKPESKMHYLTS